MRSVPKGEARSHLPSFWDVEFLFVVDAEEVGFGLKCEERVHRPTPHPPSAAARSRTTTAIDTYSWLVPPDANTGCFAYVLVLHNLWPSHTGRQVQVGHVGFFIASGSILLAPLYGWLMDRGYRFWSIWVSCLLCGLGCTLRGAAQDWVLVYAGSAVVSLGVPLWNVVLTHVAAASPPQYRPLAISAFQVSGSSGGRSGPCFRSAEASGRCSLGGGCTCVCGVCACACVCMWCVCACVLWGLSGGAPGDEQL
jgi:MFS family permease